MAVKRYDGNDKVFLAACKLAGVPVSRRQWVKYNRQGRGMAHGRKAEALRQLNPLSAEGGGGETRT